MQTLKTAVLAGAVALAAPAYAQTTVSHSEAIAAPVAIEALIGDIERVESKFLALAEAIPESSYGWRPAEGVRSVAEVFRHIAAENYFLPTMSGTAAPAESGIEAGSYPSVQAFEERELDRATTIAQLRTSFAHLKQAMRNVDEAAMGAQLEVFGMQMTGLELWVLTTTHLHEHLGQMIAYARSNGVVPPWSR